MSLYSFVDTNSASGGSTSRSAESVKINGMWLEDEISGFRILNTSGRESLSAEVDSFSVGSRHGEKIRSRRYPARNITVRYQLVASSNSDFRSKFNLLAKHLNVQDAEIIFNDETDKFYIGTPTDFSEVEEGLNSVVGEFVIFCADPFKYSVAEYRQEITSTEGSTTTFTYNGTVECRPVVRVDFYYGDREHQYGDCSFVGISLNKPDEVKVLSAGDPTESMASTVILSEDLTAGVDSDWIMNDARLVMFPPGQGLEKTGSAGYGTTAYGQHGMKVLNYGTGDTWHGPTMSKRFTASSNFTAHAILDIGVHTQRRRIFQMNITYRESGTQTWILAGVNIDKWDMTTREANVQFVIKNEIYGNSKIQLGVKNNDIWIRKTGANIVFNVFGNRYVFNTPYAGYGGEEVAFVWSAAGTDVEEGLDTYCVVRDIVIYRDPEGGFVSGNNTFHTGDRLEFYCDTGLLKLNQNYVPYYGNPSNDWEEFTLEPGSNSLNAFYSEWVQTQYRPRFYLLYREVFI